jgi:mannose-1-phosphate guanylyltransferase
MGPVNVPRQAVVLCAGEGRRLRPLTERVPKPLLPLLNVPILRHTLQRLAEAGVERVALNAWHLAEQVEAFARTAPEPRLALEVRREPELLGTGGALWNLRDWIADEPLLVLAGDIVADFDVPDLLARHRAAGAEATMSLATRADVRDFGAVEIDAQGRITDIVGALRRPGARALVNASAHVLEPAFLRRLPAGNSCLVRQGYLPALAAGARCAGALHEGAWAELGSPAALRRAQAAALRNEIPVAPALLAAGGRRDGVESLVHGKARVAAGARLLDGTVVGAGARIGRGASLRGCLVLPGASVPAGAALRDEIVEPAPLAKEAR